MGQRVEDWELKKAMKKVRKADNKNRNNIKKLAKLLKGYLNLRKP
jgi:hypothetical protein